MKLRILDIGLAILLFTTIPIGVNASSWQDQLDDAWNAGFEEGYSIGWADAECAMEYGDNGYSSDSSYRPDELDDAYDSGYEWGYERGYNQGRSDITNEDIAPQIAKAKKETIWGTVAVIYLVINPILAVILDGIPFGKRRKKQPTHVAEPAAAPTQQCPVLNSYTRMSYPDIRYMDYQNTVLILIFDNGKELHYYDVPKRIYDGLMAAPVKYEYYMENIKGEYPHY